MWRLRPWWWAVQSSPDGRTCGFARPMMSHAPVTAGHEALGSSWITDQRPKVGPLSSLLAEASPDATARIMVLDLHAFETRLR